MAGGSGFIGRHLVGHLLRAGHNVTVLTRRIMDRPAPVTWRLWDGVCFESEATYDVMINLCGLDIGGALWTSRRKKALVDSRILPTRALVQWAVKQTKKPRFINASAIGYYASSPEAQTEAHPVSMVPATFAHRLVSQWESVVRGADSEIMGCCLRFGVVLGAGGGLLKRIRWAYQCGIGAVLGSPHAAMSWVHVDDLCRAILWLISVPTISGAYNIVSPEATTQGEFSCVFAKYLHRPCWLRLPSWWVAMLFGNMGKELLLAEYVVLPERLLALGFSFHYRTIASALSALLVKGG